MMLPRGEQTVLAVLVNCTDTRPDDDFEDLVLELRDREVQAAPIRSRAADNAVFFHRVYLCDEDTDADDFDEDQIVVMWNVRDDVVTAKAIVAALTDRGIRY